MPEKACRGMMGGKSRGRREGKADGETRPRRSGSGEGEGADLRDGDRHEHASQDRDPEAPAFVQDEGGHAHAREERQCRDGQ